VEKKKSSFLFKYFSCAVVNSSQAFFAKRFIQAGFTGVKMARRGLEEKEDSVMEEIEEFDDQILDGLESMNE